MPDSPNPYESPRNVDANDPRHADAAEEVVLQGRFEVDAKLLSITARLLRTGQQVRVAILVILLLIVPVILALCTIAADFGRSDFLPYWHASCFISPLLIIVMIFVLQLRWRRANFDALERQLGMGPCTMTITERTLFLETPKGKRQRPLSEIRARKGRHNTLILLIEPNLPIAIPSSGNYSVSAFDDVVRTIRRCLHK
jgi:hypothetical protein